MIDAPVLADDVVMGDMVDGVSTEETPELKSVKLKLLYFLYNQKSDDNYTIKQISEIFENIQYDTIKKTIARMRDRDKFISSDLKVTNKGRDFIQKVIEESQANKRQRYYDKNIREFRVELAKQIEEVLDNPNVVDIIRSGINKGRIVINVEDFLFLSTFHDEDMSLLIDKVLNHPDEVISAITTVIQNQYDYSSDLVPICFIRSPVEAHSRPFTKLITTLGTKDINKLTTVDCEIIFRSPTFFNIESVQYTCSVCGASRTFLSKDLKIKKKILNEQCYSCGQKTTFINPRPKEVVDCLNVTVKDLFSELGQNQFAEPIPVWIKRDLIDFDQVTIGKRYRITGILRSIENEKDKGSFREVKIFEATGIESLDDASELKMFTFDDNRKMREIAKHPFQYFLNIIGKGFDGIDFQIKMGILSLFSDLHLFFAGDEAVGKTSVARNIAKVALRGWFSDAGNMSLAGMIGADTKDANTGTWGVSGGILQSLHPYGVLVIDEFNNDNNKINTFKPLLYELMQNGLVHINKAGTNREMNAHINIIATSNLINYDFHSDPIRKEYKIYNVEKALWSRFSFIVYFPVGLNYFKEGIISTRMKADQIQALALGTKDIIDLKKYQTYINAQEQLPRILDFSDDELKEIEHRIKNSSFDKGTTDHFFDTVSFETVGNSSGRMPHSMRCLMSAICRLRMHPHPIAEDYDTFEDLLRNIIKSKKDYFAIKQEELKKDE